MCIFMQQFQGAVTNFTGLGEGFVAKRKEELCPRTM
jgi:hypothetical protein